MRNKTVYTALAALLTLGPGAAAAAAQHAHGGGAPPPPDTRPVRDDAWYVASMLMHHEHGIEMADAAVEKVQRQDVKEFAARMVERHGAEQKRLQELRAMLGPGGAMTSGGSMPGMSGMSGMPGMSGMMSDMSGKHRQHMADMEKVKTAPAAEVDRLFLRTMTEHLKMGVDLGKQAKRGLRNAEVREFAAASNTALARDLDEVKKLERVKPAGK